MAVPTMSIMHCVGQKKMSGTPKTSGYGMTTIIITVTNVVEKMTCIIKIIITCAKPFPLLMS